MVIKTIRDKMPRDYFIRFWESKDYTGQKNHYAPYYKNKPIFSQNTTFKTLTETRRKIKTHAENIQMREAVKRMRQPKPSPTKQTIHLQGVGKVKAKRADNFKVGDTIVYNYGATAKVKKVSKKGKSVYWDTLSNGKIYSVRKNKDTLVAYR